MSTCSICLQECETPTDLPCGHSFHAECLVPWLWKSSSCPNCRFTEASQQDNNSSDVNDIRTMIQEIRQQRIEQTRKFAANLRLGKSKNAPTTLKKKIETYKKYKERIKKLKDNKKTVEENLKHENDHFNNEINSLYKTYLSDYKEMTKKCKQETKQDRHNLSKTNQKIRMDTQRLVELRLEIIDF